MRRFAGQRRHARAIEQVGPLRSGKAPRISTAVSPQASAGTGTEEAVPSRPHRRGIMVSEIRSDERRGPSRAPPPLGQPAEKGANLLPVIAAHACWQVLALTKEPLVPPAQRQHGSNYVQLSAPVLQRMDQARGKLARGRPLLLKLIE